MEKKKQYIDYINNVDFTTKYILPYVYNSEREFYYHTVTVLNIVNADVIVADKALIKKYCAKTALEFFQKTTLSSFRETALHRLKALAGEADIDLLEYSKSIHKMYGNKYLDGIFKCCDALHKSKTFSFTL
jgi:hypothetical protein